ncbi:unnamed protein product [Microthlaspi erraticum]|uniref:DUF4283 domain-containing protein n=1 Tax=Microthlaspi erraticum TaxID=1685480 RepID=A0A6D2IPV6_9BRAS|nr:unnamed protein product [Microthlaspi erraticum]
MSGKIWADKSDLPVMNTASIRTGFRESYSWKGEIAMEGEKETSKEGSTIVPKSQREGQSREYRIIGFQIHHQYLLSGILTELREIDWHGLEYYKYKLERCSIIRSYSCFCLSSILNILYGNSLWVLLLQGLAMSQGHILGAGDSVKGNKKQGTRLKITVPRFDNTALIRGYSRTLIGRCMNPGAQDVQALLHHMPRFWKMEERVGGADLGMGRFQFDFENEEDIAEVFKLEPFHFDYSMVSLVRWEPVMEPTYPSAIKFWVRMMGIPLHFWAEPTFRSIGEAIGEVLEVDIDGGRVRVCLDGYKPLIFETSVAFHSGEETVVMLRYERLFGVCRECSSLCHDVLQCPTIRRAREERERLTRKDEKPDGGVTSYKGVVINGPQGDSSGARQVQAPHAGDPKGKGKEVDAREERGRRNGGFRGNGKHVGESSGGQRKPAGYLPPEQRKRINRPMALSGRPGTLGVASHGGDTVTERTGGNHISPSQHSA